jgi:predicted phosphoribosyltransferase
LSWIILADVTAAVAPKDTVKVLKNECDDIAVVTTSPSSVFRSASQYYQVFDPVSEESYRDYEE